MHHLIVPSFIVRFSKSDVVANSSKTLAKIKRKNDDRSEGQGQDEEADHTTTHRHKSTSLERSYRPWDLRNVGTGMAF
jgi:hypothetical protein